MPVNVDHASDLNAYLGMELQSPAFELKQSDIDRFVEISGDRQWIHCDVARARDELPTGRTVVPGNLLLVQLPRLLQEIYVVSDFDKCILGEYRRIRFRHPVSPDNRLFLTAKFLSVTPTRNFVRVETDCKIRHCDNQKIALAASVVDLFYSADQIVSPLPA